MIESDLGTVMFVTVSGVFFKTNHRLQFPCLRIFGSCFVWFIGLDSNISAVCISWTLRRRQGWQKINETTAMNLQAGEERFVAMAGIQR